jgi:hypothetical protein
MAGAVIINYSTTIFQENNTPLPLVLLAIAITSFPASYLCFPGDYYSIWITKTIFWNRDYSTSYLPFLIALDIVFSLAPTLGLSSLTGFVASRLMDDHNATDFQHIAIFSTIILSLTTLMSVLLTLVQTFVLMSGLVLRAASILAARLGASVGHLEIRKYPITLCFLIAGLGSVALSALENVVR